MARQPGGRRDERRRPLETRRAADHITGMPTKRSKPLTDEALKAKALSRWEGEGGAPAGGHGHRNRKEREQEAMAADRAAAQPSSDRSANGKPRRPGP
jgi:hypothetical protein